MFNRRFIFYLIAGFLVVFLLIGYMGYREYQKHVEFERFISAIQMFNRSAEHPETDRHLHLTDTHPHRGETLDPSTAADPTNPYFVGKRGDEYVYKVGAGDYGYIYTPVPFDREDIELQAWEITGEKTPYVEEFLKKAR